jgi:hypothetical protein
VSVRECTVSFVDGRGLRHSTTVYAGSVLEAAALGLKQLRETGMLDDNVHKLFVFPARS